jgi:hypothetical protein
MALRDVVAEGGDQLLAECAITMSQPRGRRPAAMPMRSYPYRGKIQSIAATLNVRDSKIRVISDRPIGSGFDRIGS